MITFKDISFPNIETKTGRQLINVEIEYTDKNLITTLYNWQVYTPPLNGKELNNFLNENSGIYERDILKKEALWEASPKTREIEDFMGQGTITIDIDKREIVKPTIPDYEELVAMNGTNLTPLPIWNEWHYPQFSKRITAPVELTLQYPAIEVWFRYNKLPIVNEQGVLYCYCKVILDIHQELVDSLQGILTIESILEE
jgi:CBS domain-containing protein